MRHCLLSVLAFVSVLSSACTAVTNGTIPAEPNADFELAKGETAVMQGSALRIHFDTVSEESRCPTNVQCVWEGNATVRLSLDSAGRTSTVDLRTAGGAPPVQAFGHTLTLRALRPVPVAPAQLRQDQYVATLRVTSSSP